MSHLQRWACITVHTLHDQQHVENFRKKDHIYIVCMQCMHTPHTHTHTHTHTHSVLVTCMYTHVGVQKKCNRDGRKVGCKRRKTESEIGCREGRQNLKLVVEPLLDCWDYGYPQRWHFFLFLGFKIKFLFTTPVSTLAQYGLQNKGNAEMPDLPVSVSSSCLCHGKYVIQVLLYSFIFRHLIQ